MSLFRHSLLVGDDLHVPGYRVATDPGAVGAGMLWEDTDTGTLRKRNLTNTGWVIIGGAASIFFNVVDYGALGDNTTDSAAAFQATMDACLTTGLGGTAIVPSGTYLLSSNPFLSVMGELEWSGLGINLYLSGAHLKLSRQLAIPAGAMITGTGRRSAMIEAKTGTDAFVPVVNVSSVTLTSNVVTVVTAAAHRLEVGGTVLLESVTNTAFNGGWQIASVPSTTSFTFAMNPATADTTSSGGTATIPLVVLGDTAPASRATMRDVLVYCKSVVGTIGIYSNTINEQGGLQHVSVFEAYRCGVLFERSGSTYGRTGSLNYEITNLEVTCVPNVGAIGVQLIGGVSSAQSYGQTRGIDHLTVTATGGPTAGAIAIGLDIVGAPGLYSRLHLEGCTDGVRVGRTGYTTNAYGNSAVVLSGITGEETTTTLVRLINATGTSDTVLSGLVKLQGTNILVDEAASRTLTEDYLAFYATTGGATPICFTTSPNVDWKLRNDVKIIRAGANDAGLFFDRIAGQYGNIWFRTAGVNRWRISANDAAESGSDAGTNLEFVARHDDGTNIGTALTFIRSTLATLFGGNITFPTTDTYTLAALGKGLRSLVVEHAVNQATGILLRQTLTGAASPRLMFDQTADWPGQGNSVYHTAADRLTFATGATAGSASGQSRWHYDTGAIFPELTGFNLGKNGGAFGSLYAENVDSGGATDLLLKRNASTRLTLGVAAVTAAVPVILKGYTVATLPAGTVGMTAYCTDLLAPAYLAAAVGGGAVVGPVFYNGAAWVTA